MHFGGTDTMRMCGSWECTQLVTHVVASQVEPGHRTTNKNMQLDNGYTVAQNQPWPDFYQLLYKKKAHLNNISPDETNRCKIICSAV